MAEPARLSPLGAARVPGSHGAAGAMPGVTFEDRLGLSILQVSTSAKARKDVEKALKKRVGADLPGPVPGAVAGKGLTAFWASPSAWYLTAEGFGEGAFAADVAEALRKTSAGVVDQSHGRRVFRMSGPEVRRVLAAETEVDLHPKAFPAGTATPLMLGHLGCLVHAVDETVFDVHVSRGFARHLWEVLTDAAAPVGYVVA